VDNKHTRRINFERNDRNNNKIIQNDSLKELRNSLKKPQEHPKQEEEVDRNDTRRATRKRS
jgi:hypothetical protein